MLLGRGIVCYPRRMNDQVKRLADEARRLPPEARAELVDGILDSLDAADPALDGAWAEEARDRLAAYRRGEMDAADFDLTLANLAKAT